MSRRRRTQTEAAHGEDGFTLVELLISILVLTLIMGAIVNIFVVSLSATSSSLTGLNTAHDRQLIELYLPRDVQSSSSATTATLGTSVSSPTCTLPSSPAPTVVLDLKWLGMPPTTSVTTLGGNIMYYAADYGVMAMPGTGNQPTTYRLIRYYCSSITGTGTYQSLGQTTLVYALSPLFWQVPQAGAFPVYATCGTGLSACSVTTITMFITDDSKPASRAQFSVTAKMRTNS